MRLGDLVIPVDYKRRDDGYIGVIVDYDLDNDPVVLWNKRDPGLIDAAPCAVPEYRRSIEVINESR